MFLQSEDVVDIMRIGKNRATAIALVNKVMCETGLGNFVSEYSNVFDDRCSTGRERLAVICIQGRTDHNEWFLSESVITEMNDSGFPIRLVEVTIWKHYGEQKSFGFRCEIKRDSVEVTRF